jgi:hypothetical protein
MWDYLTKAARCSSLERPHQPSYFLFFDLVSLTKCLVVYCTVSAKKPIFAFRLCRHQHRAEV